MVDWLNHKMMEIKVHDHDYRINYVWNLMKKELSENNVKLIQRYDEHMISLAIAKATRSKNLQTILNLSRMIKKDWVDLTKEDVDSLVAKIMTKYGSDSGQETNSSWDHKKILKIFFRWVRLGSRDHSEVGDPPETKGIKLKKVKDTIVREDLLTDQDIEKMLAACGTNLRDRAFIDCHYEAGTRAGEILNLRIRHVKFDRYGAILHVDGKTGGRTIRLVRSVVNLAKWLDVHPYKNNPDAPLWVLFDIRHFGNPLTYNTACKIIKDK